MDSVAGAYLALALITLSKDYIIMALHRISEILLGLAEPYTLLDVWYFDGTKLSNVELAFYIFSVAVAIIQFIIGVGLPSSLRDVLQNAIYGAVSYGWGGIVYTLANLAMGTIDLVTALIAIAGFLYSIAGIIFSAITVWVNNLPWWEKAYWSVLFLGTLYAIWTNPAGFTAVLINFGLTIAAILGGFFHDYLDSNWYVGGPMD